MLKARAGNAVILGLSDMNIEKLKEGKPLVVNLKDLAFPHDINIVIFTGPTEIDMQKTLQEQFGSEPNIVVDTRFNEN